MTVASSPGPQITQKLTCTCHRPRTLSPTAVASRNYLPCEHKQPTIPLLNTLNPLPATDTPLKASFAAALERPPALWNHFSSPEEGLELEPPYGVGHLVSKHTPDQHQCNFQINLPFCR